MKFKIDESLSAEAAEILRRADFVADTVGEEHLSGADDETIASTSRSDNRILVTLDLDFANIYSPHNLRRIDSTSSAAGLPIMAAGLQAIRP